MRMSATLEFPHILLKFQGVFAFFGPIR